MNSIRIFLIGTFWMAGLSIQAQTAPPVDLSILEGKWKLDMSPENTKDSNFAMMHITKATKEGLEGDFYREGVAMSNGKVNIQTGVIHGALVSGDNSGTYNTSFYYKNGKLYGTTHSLSRGFLAVWVATKK